MTRRSLRWIGRIVVGLFLGLLLLIVFGGPYFLVSRLANGRYAYNDRANAGLTPASFEIPFEDVAFASTDGVPLQGWWVPASDARGTVVLVHGMNRSRIEMVRKVPFLHVHGWNALLFDLRAHGASGGAQRSFGYLERLDVRGATAEARRRASGPVVAWGVSMGAASVLLAAAEDTDIDGVISDSSYRSLDDTIHHHFQMARHARGWLRPLPADLMAMETLFWVRRKVGFDPESADAVAAARRLGTRPALFVSDTGDRRMPTDIAFELKAAAGPQARVLVVPGTIHAGAYREGTAAYESAVVKLLDALSSTIPGGAGTGGLKQ